MIIENRKAAQVYSQNKPETVYRFTLHDVKVEPVSLD